MESEPRLGSEIWIKACIRRAATTGVPVTVARRGDAVSGAVLVKMNTGPAACTVLAETRDEQGRRSWYRGTGVEPVSEADADAYIDRHCRRDPDIWVVEIEDRDGKYPFDDPII